MKIILTLLLLRIALIANAAPTVHLAAAVTNAPTRIELKDQFGSSLILSFPTTNLTVLTIADHKGSEQVASWVAPVKERYDLRVTIRGIADVSAVPGWLRGLVSKKFQQRQSYPVMLDWTGDTVKAFAAVNDCVNVLLLNRDGRILRRFTGKAKPGELEEMYATIDQALSDNKRPVAAK